MELSTPQVPFVHFERLLQLIDYGWKNPKPNKEGYKAHFYDVFHEAAKSYFRVFLGGGVKAIELHCIRYTEDNAFVKFPYQQKETFELFMENNWKKLFLKNDMISQMPHERIFLQFDFEQSFLIKNEFGEALDMIYGVGLFARNVVVDKQPKIALSYGLLHVSTNDQTRLDYDILHSMHLLSITDKKAKITRCDFNFNTFEDGDEPVSELENHLITRLGMVMLLKKQGMEGTMIEGVFKTSRIQGA